MASLDELRKSRKKKSGSPHSQEFLPPKEKLTDLRSTKIPPGRNVFGSAPREYSVVGRSVFYKVKRSTTLPCSDTSIRGSIPKGNHSLDKKSQNNDK